MKFRTGSLIVVSLVLMLSAAVRMNSTAAAGSQWDHHFELRSSTFENGAALPLNMIYTYYLPTAPTTNICTYNGEAGGDESPELSWTDPPRHTHSFVVVTYDVTASFTHWGMYNISGEQTGLPAGAGVAGSTYGKQIANDFGDLSYDGPCPPTSETPLVHHYVFTLYALDTMLPTLPTQGDFPPGAEALYHALIRAARDGHILDSASISGDYSAAAPPGPGSN
ncbi:MAG TPA: YbhB/YbcL family Raf kinase inhibitor-like protein [Candidatus Cybelea sp.]|nr:YbhB/YbcL family Raf kinase inhibitor-like protein [Candidatus Cybelea sp.]